MFKTVARIVTRFQGEGDGLFLGALMRGGRDHLKPNTIYEIRDVMGVLTIVEAGRATGACSGEDSNCSSETMQDPRCQFSWAMDIGNILSQYNKTMFLTETEYIQLCESYER